MQRVLSYDFKLAIQSHQGELKVKHDRLKLLKPNQENVEYVGEKDILQDNVFPKMFPFQRVVFGMNTIYTTE